MREALRACLLQLAEVLSSAEGGGKEAEAAALREQAAALQEPTA